MKKEFWKTETAPLKKELAEKFKCKFSVTKKAGSRYIHVNWIDGPTLGAVQKFCGRFNDDNRDDIMTDLFIGSQYTLEQREYSYKYHFLLDSELDLTSPPSLNDQLHNYFNMNLRRGTMRKLSFRESTEENPEAEIKTEDGQPLDTVKEVAECLRRQGFYAAVHDNDTRMVVRPRKDNPILSPPPKKEEEKKELFPNGKPFTGEYKGHPVISLPYQGGGFSFGLGKAKSVLKFLEDIKKFVEDNDK